MVVVTGGSSGIGAATVRRFLAGGDSVTVFDVGRDDVSSEPSDRLLSLEVDVRDPVAVGDALAEAEERFGPVEVLVNNAGVLSEFPLLDLAVDEFERIMSVNVTGVFVCTQVAARSMHRNGIPGRIVNLGSVNSLSVSTANIAHYAASKGAVLMLTKASALELAPYGIRVNAVGPGIVQTPLVQAVLDDPEQHEHFIRRIPRGIITSPEDVADVIHTLASDRLEAITGQLILVDGGELIGGCRLDG